MPAALALACALLLAAAPLETRALGGFPMPEGVDQAAFSKLIPLFTSTLTTCGNSSTLIDAFNLFASQQEFINNGIAMFNDFEKRFHSGKGEESKDEDAMSNPYVYGAINLLTSQGMTNLVKDPNFNALSESLNLTCVVNYPALATVIESSAQENMQKASEISDGYDSLNKVSYLIQGGLLSDVGPDIVPAYENCGGSLKSLLQFTQALAFWIDGNRQESQLKGSEDNRYLEQFSEDTPEELYSRLGCEKKF